MQRGTMSLASGSLGTFRPPPLAPLRPFWRPAQPRTHPLMIRWGPYTKRQWPLFATPYQSKGGVHDPYPSAGIESCSVEGGSRGLRNEVKYLHQVSSNTRFITVKENYTSEDCGRDAPRRGHISISR